MRRLPKFHVLAVVAALLSSAPAAAEPQTVCTITVNSPDEKDIFRRHLPAADYRFVELVERGRPDWLASACRAGVHCDMLIVSGHFDGSSEFFSDKLEAREFLPIAELERVSCSGACPGLLSQLKSVYLFGCNTLNPQPLSSASADVVRAFVREGHSPKEAERLLRSVNAGHGDSSRDRMAQVFKDVPVIYGFSSTAPLGPIAGTMLDRYFRAEGGRDIGGGHPSGRLPGYFAPYTMSLARGVTDSDAQAAARADMCRFADDSTPVAAKLDFVHQLLHRHVAATRLNLDRIQRLTATLDDDARASPAVARALDAIVQDGDARERFLDFSRGGDRAETRVRLLDIAHDLGWLTADERRDELALMLGELLRRADLGIAEVDLACTLNAAHELDGAFDRGVPARGPADDVAHAAVRACLGSDEGRARTLAGLVGSDEAGVLAAQAYLRRRPIDDAAELRRVAADIAGMAPSAAQVRALETLGRHYVSDDTVVDGLVRLFARTPSAAVQAAIAGILMRADARSIGRPQLAHTLRDNRRPDGAGDRMVDALLERLQRAQ